MQDRNIMMTADGLNIIAGLWLIAAPYLLGFSGTTLSANSIVIGIAVAAIALIRVVYPMTTSGLDWLNVVLGAWLLFSPFFMGAASAGAQWNSIIIGIIVGGLALWSAITPTMRHGGRPTGA